MITSLNMGAHEALSTFRAEIQHMHGCSDQREESTGLDGSGREEKVILLPRWVFVLCSLPPQVPVVDSLQRHTPFARAWSTRQAGRHEANNII